MAGRTPRRNERPDHDGTHRLAFERNKKKIYATQTVCGIYGKPVDFSYKFPHPLSPCIDHIIPVVKGGHPSDLDNLQLAHFCCNRAKSDKLVARSGKAQEQAEAEARAQAQAAQAQAQTQAETQTASRSSERADISSVPTAPASATGQALADYALQFQGYPYVSGGNTPSGWDCSGFVQWVFAQFGVSLPHYSGAQMSVGTAVGSIAEAAPGDIIVNTQHAAIYIGNGMVINALNPAQGTQVTSLAVFSGGYAIRRVL